MQSAFLYPQEWKYKIKGQVKFNISMSKKLKI